MDRRVQRGAWRVELRVEENGEWREDGVESGEWRMERGEWNGN